MAYGLPQVLLLTPPSSHPRFLCMWQCTHHHGHCGAPSRRVGTQFFPSSDVELQAFRSPLLGGLWWHGQRRERVNVCLKLSVPAAVGRPGNCYYGSSCWAWRYVRPSQLSLVLHFSETLRQLHACVACMCFVPATCHIHPMPSPSPSCRLAGEAAVRGVSGIELVSTELHAYFCYLPS